jgi:organic radical activating enzyme
LTYRVSDIFYSLQGEGYNKGRAAVFVRFHGCNLSCDFCDETRDAHHEELTAQEIADNCVLMDSGHSRRVVLTGGEPLLQADSELGNALRSAGFYHIWVETNGTVRMPVGLSAAWVTCSPKQGHPVMLSCCDELRVPLRSGEQWPGGLDRLNPRQRYVSPVGPGAVEYCAGMCLSDPTLRLTTQCHKCWGVE